MRFSSFLALLILVSCLAFSAYAGKGGKCPRLNIAQVSTIGERVPPAKYGGVERVVYYLVQELKRRGHHVTLFASHDSVGTSADQLISHERWPAGNRYPAVWKANSAHPTVWEMTQVRKMAPEFDILHFHCWFDHMPIVQDFVQRTVTTLHGDLNQADLPALFGLHPGMPFVAISDNQRSRTHKDAVVNFAGVVHNGIPEDLYKFSPHPGKDTGEEPYLAFLGRIYWEKRPEQAIEIAVRAGMKLKIAARLEAEDDPYWLETVKPLIEKHSDFVEFIGEVNDQQKGEFLGNASAMLFPIEWAEPFGLVMIESMACGTPVLARRIGSVPEIVQPGVTGDLFETIDEAVAKIHAVTKLDRARVRHEFEQRFTAEKMVDGYLAIYEKLARENPRP